MHPQPKKKQKKPATTTTSCVNRYKTKTKQETYQNFFKTLGLPYDTTNIEDCNKLQNKGSKGLATTTQLYTAKIRFSQKKKEKKKRSRTTGKLAA